MTENLNPLSSETQPQSPEIGERLTNLENQVAELNAKLDRLIALLEAQIGNATEPSAATTATTEDVATNPDISNEAETTTSETPDTTVVPDASSPTDEGLRDSLTADMGVEDEDKGSKNSSDEPSPDIKATELNTTDEGLKNDLTAGMEVEDEDQGSETSNDETPPDTEATELNTTEREATVEEAQVLAFINQIAKRDNARAAERYKGLFGKIKNWFYREGERRVAETLAEAGEFQERSDLRKWAAISAKVVGGFGVAGAMVFGGGVGFLTPAVWSLALREGIDGVMQAAEKMGWGNKRRSAELEKQALVSQKITQLKDEFRAGNLTPDRFHQIAKEIIEADNRVQEQQVENFTAEQKAKMMRAIASTVVTAGIGIFGGVPLGTEVAAEPTEIAVKTGHFLDNAHQTQWSLGQGYNFVYGPGEASYAIDAANNAFLTVDYDTWGRSIHTMGQGLSAAKAQSLLTGLAALFGGGAAREIWARGQEPTAPAPTIPASTRTEPGAGGGESEGEGEGSETEEGEDKGEAGTETEKDTNKTTEEGEKGEETEGKLTPEEREKRAQELKDLVNKNLLIRFKKNDRGVIQASVVDETYRKRFKDMTDGIDYTIATMGESKGQIDTYYDDPNVGRGAGFDWPMRVKSVRYNPYEQRVVVDISHYSLKDTTAAAEPEKSGLTNEEG